VRRQALPRSVSAVVTNATTGQNELDSHADTCALGSNFVPLHFTGRVCDVSPYNPNTYSPERNIPIVSAATAYTDQRTGQVFIIVINEALWFGNKMPNSLINPNQLRFAGVSVRDNPFECDFSISHDDLSIPLQTVGTTIYFDSTTPSQAELDTSPHVHLTLDTEWNPHTVRLAYARSVEAEYTSDSCEVEPGLLQISSIHCATAMAANITDNRDVKAIDVEARRTFVSNNRHSSITQDQLSEHWGIGIKQAQQTLRVTTQRGVRSAILPLSRRYRTDRMYNQRKLRDQKFYTDTLFGKYKSISNNTCAQIFANEAYFVKAYPMEKKASAGLALRQFVRDYRVPENLTSDSAAEQTGPKSEFMQTVRKFDIDHHTTEPQ